MFKVKFNKQHSVVDNTVFGIGLSVVILVIQNQPSSAGPQSLLDPYADVNPISSKPESKIKKAFKQTVKQRENKADINSANNIESIEANNGTSASVPDGSNKVKVKGPKAEKIKLSHAESPGFFSGIKEMKHGSITSIKAAGGGIVSGSKAAGSKVADGTKSIGSGIAAASSKVISGPKDIIAKTKSGKSKKTHLAAVAANPGVNSGHKGLISKLPALKLPKFKKTSPQVANAGFSSELSNPIPTPVISSAPGKPIFPALPGKPLDQVLAQEKQRKRLKDVTFTEGEKRKPGIITNAVGKIGFLHKAKKVPATNAVASSLTANNNNNLMPQ